MPVVAVIPLKSFDTAKERLASQLDQASRRQLGTALALRAVETAEAAGALPLVVAGDEEVSGWAAGLGVAAIPEPGTGLDAAAGAGVIWSEELGHAWLVVHADLPLVVPGDLAPLVEWVDRGCEVVAPSADGGTSALGASRSLRFSYGPGSFHRHLPRLRDPLVRVTAGLAHDLDSVADLVSARRHPRGAWLREY